MRPSPTLAAAALIAVLLAPGCAETVYRPMGSAAEPARFAERRVEFRLTDGFWRDPPRCAAILPAPPGADPALYRTVAAAAERHLAARLPTVIGPARTAAAERRLGLDLAHEADRGVFARTMRCPARLEIVIGDVADEFLVFWAHRSLAITLRLTRSDDGRLLWTARHSAGRSEGGLPLSPLSAPLSFAQAARLSGDTDVFASIADDIVRRMMVTLPDTRSGADIAGPPGGGR